MKRIWRGALKTAAYLLSPLLVAASALALALVDVAFLLFGKRRLCPETPVRRRAVSIVIPTWNGRDLLANFLPGVIRAAAGRGDNEIIVVDNASTDGTVEYLQRTFPGVRVLALDKNLGFAGGSNAGIAAARNDIAVLLNNDMRVDPGFLPPLLELFSDPHVFAVSCQIFLSDPEKRREETGLTEVWWERGRLGVSHRVDPQIRVPFPCAYAGGGSTAFDRKKFLELGGFDHLFSPFYYEDTDLGHAAWKRGWKVLYQPASVVYHEHRGTIGKHFSRESIDSILRKNVILYCWKNIHDWKMLPAHFAACLCDCLASPLSDNARERYAPLGLGRAFSQLPGAMKARWRAHSLSAVSDVEAFRRPLAGYFRDRFEAPASPVPHRLQILFASPYPIEPPIHGGAVFMHETLRMLAPFADVHLVSFVDEEKQLPAQEALRFFCRSAQFHVRRSVLPRNPATLVPHAVREFSDRDFAWTMHRTIYLEQIDVVQLEYTTLSQYRGDYKYIPCILFEHDISFQSLWRWMRASGFTSTGVLEYVRMLRYELQQISRCTRVQVCTNENARYLLEFLPDAKDRIDTDVRALVDTSKFKFPMQPRRRNTILFVGNFRHTPNTEGLRWFTDRVFPFLLRVNPSAVLIVVGCGAPEELSKHPNIRLAGFIEDIREPLEQYAVFICPILSGSGIRVKMLEAFAAGIPVVSTRMGAEGLASESGLVCELADSPEQFAACVQTLLQDEAHAAELAARARKMVEREKDSRAACQRLLDTYRLEAARHRPQAAELIEQVAVASGYGTTR